MVVICYVSNTTWHDRRTPGISNAPLHMKQAATLYIEKKKRPLR